MGQKFILSLVLSWEAAHGHACSIKETREQEKKENLELLESRRK